MKKITSQRLRLGLFVMVGTGVLVLGLYYVGQQRNIFHKTIEVCADFANVDGLMPGNNVRFNGFDVGTVLSLAPATASTIHVSFSIEEDYVELISIQSIASIGTDGLLGNKLLNIEPGASFERAIRESDCLQTRELVAMDAAMRTLNETNNNLLLLSKDLLGVTERLSQDNAFWRFLADTTLSDQLKRALVKVSVVSENTAILSGDLRDIVQGIRRGEGSLGALITDTSLYHGLKQTVVRLNMVGDTLAIASGNFSTLADQALTGKGLVATLLTDTMMVHDINQTVWSIQGAAEGLNENMALLRQSRLLKRYFKRASKTED
jgi:phospholipid/cholesterol/gamma-HCH transport system substrate-binding protein